jgi:hypothetical protein
MTGLNDTQISFAHIYKHKTKYAKTHPNFDISLDIKIDKNSCLRSISMQTVTAAWALTS